MRVRTAAGSERRDTGAVAGGGLLQSWYPGNGDAAAFGSFAIARALIGAGELNNRGLGGAGVNVVIVDQGLNGNYVNHLRPGAYAGGFDWPLDGTGKRHGQSGGPHTARPREHGNAMARSVLALAPEAKTFDAPLIPRRIVDVDAFAHDATSGFAALKTQITTDWATGKVEPWVILCAWGVFDRLAETGPVKYTREKRHPLNAAVDDLALSYDVVFSAGNSGQFCPDVRSGPYDRGPGRSIWGANALASVVTVGATRADGLWSGMSSQGPGPDDLGPERETVNEKPDLCAPSWFRDDRDRSLTNTGSSAAAAVTAGVIAALRSNPK